MVYHTGVFGPIDLEYQHPIVRVGRNPDNDLVLPHQSVEPYHCTLVFREEKLLLLPPDFETSKHTATAAATEHSAGEDIWIGELRFSLAHSSTSVVLPGIAGARTVEASEKAATNQNGSSGAARNESRYYCAKCGTYYREAEVKQIGLVGHAKRSLCPRCSCVLGVEGQNPAAASALNSAKAQLSVRKRK